MTRGARPKGEHRSKKTKGKNRPVSRNGVDYRAASKSGCSSGKWAWTDNEDGRRGAKSLLKVLKKSGGKAVRVYTCPECARLHVGHIPHSVRQGKASTRDIYGGDR